MIDLTKPIHVGFAREDGAGDYYYISDKPFRSRKSDLISEEEEAYRRLFENAPKMLSHVKTMITMNDEGFPPSNLTLLPLRQLVAMIEGLPIPHTGPQVMNVNVDMAITPHLKQVHPE